MIFTDDDLKRLKEKLEIYGEVPLYTTQGKALLARLEAAEACMEFVGHDNCDYKDVERVLKTWRKSAGKEQGK
jgi:hypothetical protein